MCAPLQIFVLFHPNYEGGQDLAKAVKSLFALEGTKSWFEGVQIDVDFRSTPAPDSVDSLPLPISVENAESTLVVVLVDQTLRNDQQWVEWIAKLKSTEKISIAAFYLGQVEPLECLNPQNENRLELQKGDDFVEEVERHREELLRKLTIRCVTHLGGLDSAENSSYRPQLFYSYHHDDGKSIVDELVSRIKETHPALKCFVAHQDLPLGANYETGIGNELRECDALISVFTTEYPERRWCQQEIRATRTPRRVANRFSCWEVKPVVVVDALDGVWSRIPDEFTGCPILRWDEEPKLMIHDRALLGAVFSLYNRRRALTFSREHENDGLVAINWIPEARTIADLKLEHEHMRKQAREENQEIHPLTQIWYPGAGIETSERERLEEVFDIEMQGFDEV